MIRPKDGPSKQKDPELLKLVQVIDGLNQHEVAADAGVTQTTITRLRRGIGQPQFFVIQCIAEAVGYEVIIRPKEAK